MTFPTAYRTVTMEDPTDDLIRESIADTVRIAGCSEADAVAHVANFLGRLYRAGGTKAQRAMLADAFRAMVAESRARKS